MEKKKAFGLLFKPTNSLTQIDDNIFKEKPIEMKFDPPAFGLTVLGASHGFDGIYF